MSTLHVIEVQIEACAECTEQDLCSFHQRISPGLESVRVLNHEVSDSCRLWLQCDQCHDLSFDEREEFLQEHDGEDLHGIEHEYIDGELCVPTKRCLVEWHEYLADVAYDLGSGVHTVTHSFGDGTELFLEKAPA